MRIREQRAEDRGQAVRLALEREIFWLEAIEERLEQVADFLETCQMWIRAARTAATEARRHGKREAAHRHSRPHVPPGRRSHGHRRAGAGSAS